MRASVRHYAVLLLFVFTECSDTRQTNSQVGDRDSQREWQLMMEQKERGEGERRVLIFILKPAVWACCSCSCRFVHATIKKALGGDSGPGDDADDD